MMKTRRHGPVFSFEYCVVQLCREEFISVECTFWKRSYRKMALKVGSRFDSYSAFQAALEEYEKRKLANFYHYQVIKLKEEDLQKVFVYKTLRLKCKYGGKVQKVVKRNIRQTKTYRENCPAIINVNFCRKGGYLRVTKIVEQHSHELTGDAFKTLPKQRRLSEAETKYVREMNSVKGNAKLMQAQLNSDERRSILLRDIHNQKKTTDAATSDGDIVTFMNEVRKIPDATVELFTDETNELQGIFFQTDRMKLFYKAYPDVLLIDATYGTNNRRMPVFLLVVVDGNGESQIVCLFITRSENYETMMKLFAKFKHENTETSKLTLAVTDKNFAERRAISESFPGIQLQLCIFHVLQVTKWMRVCFFITDSICFSTNTIGIWSRNNPRKTKHIFGRKNKGARHIAQDGIRLIARGV